MPSAELKKANKELKVEINERVQAEEVFKTLSNSSPVGVYTVIKGKFLLVNPQFERSTGYSNDQLLGIDSMTLVHTEDRELVRDNAVKMLKGQTSIPYEYRVKTKSGNTRWVMETVAPIKIQG